MNIYTGGFKLPDRPFCRVHYVFQWNVRSYVLKVCLLSDTCRLKNFQWICYNDVTWIFLTAEPVGGWNIELCIISYFSLVFSIFTSPHWRTVYKECQNEFKLDVRPIYCRVKKTDTNQMLEFPLTNKKGLNKFYSEANT